jgi:DNA-binding MurR/RpiR family transcriptional regulator
MVQFHAIPRAGSTAIDDIAWADHQDVLIAITSAPYRKEVIETARLAKEQGLCVIAMTDSLASPIARIAEHTFITQVDTPQFFPSSVSLIALLEILLSFVISVASDEIVDRVDTFHKRRHALGLYGED